MKGFAPRQYLALYAKVFFFVISKELFILFKRLLWFRDHSHRIEKKFGL